MTSGVVLFSVRVAPASTSLLESHGSISLSPLGRPPQAAQPEPFSARTVWSLHCLLSRALAHHVGGAFEERRFRVQLLQQEGPVSSSPVPGASQILLPNSFFSFSPLPGHCSILIAIVSRGEALFLVGELITGRGAEVDDEAPRPCRFSLLCQRRPEGATVFHHVSHVPSNPPRPPPIDSPGNSSLSPLPYPPRSETVASAVFSSFVDDRAHPTLIRVILPDFFHFVLLLTFERSGVTSWV